MPKYIEAQVAAQRKIPGKKPKIARPTGSVEISNDFEAFLILMKESARASTMTWISTLLQLFYSPAGGFDSISKQMILLEMALDGVAEVEFLDAKMRLLIEPWNLIKRDIATSDWQDVPEVVQMIDDISIGMKEIGTYQDQLEHQASIVKILAKSLTLKLAGLDGDAAAYKNLLNSYVSAMGAYIKQTALG